MVKKRFKTKRNNNYFLIFILFFSIIVLLISYSIFKKVDKNIIINNKIDNINYSFNKNKFLLKNALNFDLKEDVILPTFEEVVEDKKIKMIYIYNTHQTEAYKDTNVYEAAILLKEKLSNYNINAIVEDTNIKSEMDKNGYNYSQSYRVTKELLNKYLDKDIALYIDLHRDSSNKNITTYDKYAKLMFVIGGNHDNYLNNYQVAEDLNRFIKNIDPAISRGIYLRKTSNYNQELDSKIILIELGGPYNTREEINNSIDCLALAISNYLSE